MIIGTAGHIDHGKTALVKALTGVDGDRLKDEKARGITIDLGFAYLPLPAGPVLGFIDVPGHERFVHTMLAGATGIDFALLTVAANDGIKPQTLEHLRIIDLLGIGRGAVVLTKADLATPERIAEVAAEVGSALSGTTLEGAPILKVSALTGDGIEQSAASLGAEARDPLKSIPSAILRSSLFVGLFFIFSSYVLVLGFHGQPEALDKSGAPLHVLAEGAGLGVLKHWIDLGAAISFLACTLASINAGARILFQLGRHGFFHNAVGNTHEINKTPHVAAGLIAIATLIPPVALALLGTAPFDIFGWTGSFASYGFIVAYVLISLAAAAHLGRHKRLTAGALVSVAGAIIVLVIALAGNLYPVPPAPLNWLPYAFLAYLALGVLWFGALKLVWPTVAEEVRRDAEAEAATLEKSIA